jgi:putative transposase
MRTGRPKAALVIGVDERAQLAAMARSRRLPAALTLRARIVLACAREPSNQIVAGELGIGPHTVGKWRNRFVAERLAGLYDELRSGRPRTIEDEAVAELVAKTLASKPTAGTHWTVRAMAAETQLSKSAVHRFFQLFGLQPHRTRSFKLSTDPFFVDKLRDVVGLYLNPPDKALVLCVDEKSQVQALERTQPLLPMGFGYIEGVTHDDKRHGTTTLFAALNLLDGSVLAQCKPHHRHQEFLSFLRHIEANVPAELDLHVVVDNYATHKHPKVRAWLAQRRVGTSTSPQPTPPGSTRWSASSRWPPSVRSLAVPLLRSPTWSARSTTSSTTTMARHSLSSGPPPPTQSSKNSPDFVIVFPGQHTRSAGHRLSC